MYNETFDNCRSRYHGAVVWVWRLAQGLDCGVGEVGEGGGWGGGEVDECVAEGGRGVGRGDLVLD